MSLLSPQTDLNEHQKAKLDRFETTREACLIVFVLAGAAESKGRTTREILQGADRLTEGCYEHARGRRALRFARFYLSHAGYLTCAPRMNPMSGRSASAFTGVPLRLRPAWRRSEWAEEQAGRAAKAALEERFPPGLPQRNDGRDRLPGCRLLKRLASLLG